MPVDKIFAMATPEIQIGVSPNGLAYIKDSTDFTKVILLSGPTSGRSRGALHVLQDIADAAQVVMDDMHENQSRWARDRIAMRRAIRACKATLKLLRENHQTHDTTHDGPDAYGGLCLDACDSGESAPISSVLDAAIDDLVERFTKV